MEKRLEDFIASVQKLSDLRNLDVFNPIVFQMEHPVNATRYIVVGAKQEPSYLGIPINSTWVVLDSSDTYYLQALKLKDVIDPLTVTDKPAVLTGARWHLVRSYEEIFIDPQFYDQSGPVGPTGPQGIGIVGPIGPTGVDGPVGPTGVIGPQGPGGVGSTGPQGIQGNAGIQGVAGPVGPTGAQGVQGIQGIVGLEGPVGPTGEKGATGAKGNTGNTGPVGPVGPTGVSVQRISTGPQVLATGTFVDLDPKALFSDPALDISTVLIKVGVLATTGSMNGLYQTPQSGVNIGYDATKIRIANDTADSITVEGMLTKL